MKKLLLGCLLFLGCPAPSDKGVTDSNIYVGGTGSIRSFEDRG